MNDHMMRSAAFPVHPTPAVRDEQDRHHYADMSVRGANSANQPGSVAGVGSHAGLTTIAPHPPTPRTCAHTPCPAADTGPPPEFSLRRNSVGSLVVPAECVKTISGASDPGPPSPPPLPPPPRLDSRLLHPDSFSRRCGGGW